MMSKPISALFGVLTLVAILAIAPSAFADESQTTVNISAGAGSGPNCSQSNNCFSPDTVTVAPGTTVEWQNNDKVSHTVTSGSPSDNQTGTIFDSSLIAAGKDFTFTFNNPGTYNYFCQVHPWMTGQVIVSASAATIPSTPSTPSTTSSMPSSMNTTNNTSTTSSTPSTPSMPSTPSTTSSMPSSMNTTNNTSTTSTSAPAVPVNSAPATPATYAPTTTTTTSPSASVGYSDADNPTGPLQMTGWGAGMAVVAIMTGIGIWSSVRRR